MQFGGFRLLNEEKLDRKYHNGNDYVQKLGICEGFLDIPKSFEDVTKYNGTLAHKTNFGFERNVIATPVSSNLK